MKHLYYIFVLVCFYKGLYAQRDEVLKDTLVDGKHFNVIMYNDDNRAACVGHYITHTFIRTGEWDYFYNDGKISAQTFFRLNDKTSIWIYYDEQGNIIREIEPCKKRHSFIDYYCNKNDDNESIRSYYQLAQQNKNACVLYSHGSEPLEYDERIYKLKVKKMIYNMSLIQGDNSYVYKNIPMTKVKKHTHKS